MRIYRINYFIIVISQIENISNLIRRWSLEGNVMLFWRKICNKLPVCVSLVVSYTAQTHSHTFTRTHVRTHALIVTIKPYDKHRNIKIKANIKYYAETSEVKWVFECRQSAFCFLEPFLAGPVLPFAFYLCTRSHLIRQVFVLHRGAEQGYT